MICFRIIQLSKFSYFIFKGLYGVYFTNPVAFSAASLAQTFGLFLGSLSSTYFCTNVKYYIYLSLISLSMISYLAIAIKHVKLNNKKIAKNTLNENIDIGAQDLKF